MVGESEKIYLRYWNFRYPSDPTGTQSGALAGNYIAWARQTLDSALTSPGIMQPIMTTHHKLLGQTLQTMSQVLEVQQQQFARQQKWLHQNLFSKMQMTRNNNSDPYIEVFERTAIQAGLDHIYWASQLGMLVIGKAQAAYRALPREEAQDCAKVKVAILYCLDIMPEHYQCLFQAKKPCKDQHPRILMPLLWDLMSKWLWPATYIQDALANQVLLELFLADLEKGTQCWVQHHMPQNSKETLCLTKAFALSEVEYRSSGSCDSEKKQSLSTSGVRNVTCSHCVKTRHMSKDYWNKTGDWWRPEIVPQSLYDQPQPINDTETMDCSYRRIERNVSWSSPLWWPEWKVEMSRLHHIQAAHSPWLELMWSLKNHPKGPTPLSWRVHMDATHCERKFVPIRAMAFQGELRMGIVAKLTCEVVLGCDWSPIYQVINLVREAEKDCQWLQNKDEWVREAESDQEEAYREEEPIQLIDISSAAQFREALHAVSPQEKDISPPEEPPT